MIKLSTDENEIKTITLEVTEQEFRIIQIKKSIKNYKKENLGLSPKNSEVLSATLKSGSSRKETKIAENDIKPEVDMKSNSNYSSTTTSNNSNFSLQNPELSPDHFKTLTEKTEINTNEKLKLLEEEYDAAKSIILSDAQDEYENKQPFEFPNETSELETKPNRAFNLYPNVIVKERDIVLKPSNAKETHSTSYPNVTEKQKDTVLKSLKPKKTHKPSSPNVTEKQRNTVLKPSNAKQIHNSTFEFLKQETKFTSKHFENPIPKIYLNDNPIKNDPNNKKQI